MPFEYEYNIFYMLCVCVCVRCCVDTTNEIGIETKIKMEILYKTRAQKRKR